MKREPVCVKCGSCMSVCPVYKQTELEADVARGKMALLDWSENAENPPDILSSLDRCLLCGACQDNCAAKVKTTDKITLGRKTIFDLRGHSLISLLQLEAMTGDSAHARLLRKGPGLAKALLQKKAKSTSGLYLRFPLSFFTGRDYVPVFKNKPYISKNKAGLHKGPKVGYFVGCGANHILQDQAKALEKTARIADISLVVPNKQGCCGLAHYSNGDIHTAKKCAVDNLNAFSADKLDATVTTCASCLYFIHKMPELFEDNEKYKELARNFAEKTMDATEYFLKYTDIPEKLEKASEKLPEIKVYYHTPCHLRFGKSKSTAPRELLEKAYSLIPVTEIAPQCCGHGGSFNLHNYGLSVNIFEKYGEKIQEASPDIISSGCTGCLLQFEEGVSRWNKTEEIKVAHPLSLVYLALNDK